MGNRFEITTVGFDESLQGVGSDPYGSGQYVGLRVPTFIETNQRVMFMLALARFSAGQKARLVGMRQYVTIGQTIPNSTTVSTTITDASGGAHLPQAIINVADTTGFASIGVIFVTTGAGVQTVTYTGKTPTSFTGAAGGTGVMELGASVTQTITTNYPLEKEVKTPSWKFVDGNISWHLRRVPPGQQVYFNTGNKEGEQFRYGQTPAILFETSLDAGYSAPYGGQPPGNIAVPDFGTFHDLRFPWRDSQVWNELDVEFEGPCDIALFASVQQSNPLTRAPLILPTGVPLDVLGPEDAFIAGTETGSVTGCCPQQGPAPNAIYWRIAGSLIFDNANFIPKSPDEAAAYDAERNPRCLNTR